MTSSLLGLNVVRSIPPEVITGLSTGQYKMYGGVIRWAPGTQHSGQIVRHLLPVAAQTVHNPLFMPVSSAFKAANTYQLHKMNMTMQQVLQMATSTMALSGLNLAVSSVSFAVINQRLKTLETQLELLFKEVQRIQEMLELKERAELGAALQDLLYAMQSNNAENRRHMLFAAKKILAPINLKYKELMAQSSTLEEAMGYEEYFSLTSLAHTRCLAELGMPGIAEQHISNDVAFWEKEARRIINEQILMENPERFMSSDFVEQVPVTSLIEWLDFSFGEERGYDWIDEMRSKTTAWYPQSNRIKSSKSEINKTISSFKRTIGGKKQQQKHTIDREKELMIPSIQKLVARHKVLKGYTAQYELLKMKEVAPSQLEEQIKRIDSDLVVDGYVILEGTED